VVIDDFVRRRRERLTCQAGHVLALQATALDGADTSARGPFARVGSGPELGRVPVGRHAPRRLADAERGLCRHRPATSA
jgi:hypothetical protein